MGKQAILALGLGVAAWLGGGLPAAAAEPAGEFADGVIATVNDQVITLFDVTLQTRFFDNLQRNKVLASDAADKTEAFERAVREYRLETVQRLIDTEVIYAEFERRGYRLPDDVVTRQVDSIVAAQTAGNWQQFERELADMHMTMAELRARIRKRISVDAFLNQEIDQKIAVSPKAMRDHYQRHLAAFSEPAEVQLQMIMLARGKQDEETFAKRVNAVAVAVAESDDFLALAKAHSDSPGKATADDIGWVEASQMAPELRQALKTLQAGEVAGPVEMNQAVFFVKVVAGRGGSVLPFDQVQARVRQELTASERKRRYEDLIASLRYKVVIRRMWH
jgi:peptidyl-prolyl cis-trans isomerase SurA